MTKKFSDFEIVKKYTHKDKGKVVSYICEFYSQHSELNKIQDLQERKEAACAMVKLNPKDPYIEEILAMKQEQVNELVFHYLSFYQNSNRFNKLISDQQLLFNMLSILRKPIDETLDEDELEKKMKSRANISQLADGLISSCDRLMSEIYGEKEVVEVADTMIRRMISPEERVKKIA